MGGQDHQSLEGVLYQTGRVARILPDGKLDFLENGGRVVMQEAITGRSFLDLERLERLLREYDGVLQAEAYVKYTEGNKTILQADIRTEGEVNVEKIREYLAENCEKELIPQEIRGYCSHHD